jgi:membrane-bound serine protease (ClpP class)
MSPMALIIVLYVSGVVLLVLELLLPSHGLLTLGALTCLGVAVYLSFQQGTAGGITGLLVSLVVVPTILGLGIRYIHRLPMGDRFAPPNPTLEEVLPTEDRTELAAMIGRRGLATGPLSPTGICEFDGRRVQCVSEFGWIDAGRQVEAVGVNMKSLVVRAVADSTA